MLPLPRIWRRLLALHMGRTGGGEFHIFRASSSHAVGSKADDEKRVDGKRKHARICRVVSWLMIGQHDCLRSGFILIHSPVRLELCFKLFLVMGISFTLEFIFWCIESGAVGGEPSVYWIVADLFNFLVRPILVFYLLGWKKCNECIGQ